MTQDTSVVNYITLLPFFFNIIIPLQQYSWEYQWKEKILIYQISVKILKKKCNFFVN